MERVIRGTPVVPGVGWGPIVRPAPRPQPPVITQPSAGIEEETNRFSTAQQEVISRLEHHAANASGAAGQVLTTTAAMAGDPGLTDATITSISHGHNALQAVWYATNRYIEQFKAAGGMLAERTTDLADVRDRIMAELLGQPEPGVPIPDEPSVLLADDLAPADTALLDPRVITAIATRLGGPTSHTAIIARQLGIPCVVGVKNLNDLDSTKTLLVDGHTGALTADPDPTQAEKRLQESRKQAEKAACWSGPGRTRDGHEVQLLANVQDASGAKFAAAGVPVGVGLLRTELTFLNSPSEPTIEQQQRAYAGVIEAFPEGKVVIRTLDAGSDKPMPFLTYDGEENPALGVRGIRISRDHPGIIERQLEAIAGAAPPGFTPWVMAPMISDADEAGAFAAEVRSHGLIPGVMIEVPAAALKAEQILAEVDFVSIGTNDLSQYTMAADRLSPDLAHLCDPWQPAVLDLIAAVCEAGRKADKPVGVCGEAAADPLLACVLVGMGVSSLSAATTALPLVGATLGEVDLETCQRAAEVARKARNAEDARDQARAVVHP